MPTHNRTHFISRAAACAIAFAACAVSAATDITNNVRLDLFYSPGCSECERLNNEVLPDFEEQFEGFYDLVRHNMNLAATIPLFIAYQNHCGNTNNGLVSIIIDHTTFLSGIDAIATGLTDRVEAAIEARQSPGWIAPLPPLTEEQLAGDAGKAIVAERRDALTVSVVALGGLVDGFNPCAISTLIFFMSVLAIAKAARRTRLLVGISFISASFLVYMGLGLGFLFIFRQMPNFDLVKKIVEIGLGLCMIPLAILSFRDAFRFRKSQRPDDVTLQIPKKIKTRIHAFMNTRLGWGGPVIGGLVTGAGVTILESVCTGQSYVPVLMYMLKQDCSDLRAWLLLTLYNLLFILPLAVVFICFHRGMQLQTLIAWSKRNLVIVKIILGVFFAAMALLLLWPKNTPPQANHDRTHQTPPPRP